MPSWCLTISDAEPPSAGIYHSLSKNGATVTVHQFRNGGTGLFIYAGASGRNVRGYGLYPHVTLMLESALHQKAGMLFFRCSEFHVSTSESCKLFFRAVNGRFVQEQGQRVMGMDAMQAMAATVNRIIRPDITSGITPEILQQGRGMLGPEDSHGLPPWEREARAKQALENDQARLRDIVQVQNEAWARQFEWPEGM